VSICLIDGDLLVYRVGFATEKRKFAEAIRQVDNWIEKILDTNDTMQYKLYLSDSDGNFRKALYSEYKANRKSKKPRHYEAIINYLLSNWDATVAWGEEADDAMGVYQSNHANTVICTVDKDLDQIPGKHYNFITGEQYEVAPEQGLQFFYQQLLMGDATDNIPGLQGIGGVKAARILKGCVGEPELFRAAHMAYNQAYEDVLEAEDKMLLSGRLVKIRQKPGEIWEFPR
jgi:5''-3'' exonuclease (including N-terminal domain of PolI)